MIQYLDSDWLEIKKRANVIQVFKLIVCIWTLKIIFSLVNQKLSILLCYMMFNIELYYCLIINDLLLFYVNWMMKNHQMFKVYTEIENR